MFRVFSKMALLVCWCLLKLSIISLKMFADQNLVMHSLSLFAFNVICIYVVALTMAVCIVSTAAITSDSQEIATKTSKYARTRPPQCLPKTSLKSALGLPP